MVQSQPALPKGPRTWVKCVVSVLVVLHLGAILTAVTSASGGRFNAPYLAVKANEPCRPYLQTVFLSNAYRFFAPNPGPATLTWFRLSYQDGSVRWVELPRREDFGSMAYQRHLSLPALGTQTMPDPKQPEHQVLTPSAHVCLASYVRFLAKQHAHGTANPVVEVKAFNVSHTSLLPGHVRMGWEALDLRLYQPTFLGRYGADGVRSDDRPVSPGPMSLFVADILAEDVIPFLGAVTLDDLRLPGPVHRVVTRFPELLTAAEQPMRERLKVAVESQDTSDVRKGLIPGLDYPLEW